MDTVLVVDDNPTSVEVLGYLLESKGYSVLRAESATEAESVSKLHDGPISLLVTDAALRSITGQELANRIRAARPELQILYISGYTSVHLITAGELKWNAPFLQKPFSADVFLKTVGDLLKTARRDSAAG
jgi:two-component system, cell cycle sensor histidine kinase and response regulator CckA